MEVRDTAILFINRLLLCNYLLMLEHFFSSSTIKTNFELVPFLGVYICFLRCECNLGQLNFLCCGFLIGKMGVNDTWVHSNHFVMVVVLYYPYKVICALSVERTFWRYYWFMLAQQILVSKIEKFVSWNAITAVYFHHRKQLINNICLWKHRFILKWIRLWYCKLRMEMIFLCFK